MGIYVAQVAGVAAAGVEIALPHEERNFRETMLDYCVLDSSMLS